MEYGFTTAAYVVAAVLFILSLGGLSGQESAKRAVWYGIVGMGLAVVATLYGPGAGNWFVSVVMIAIGGGIGWVVAQRVQMTEMPQLVAAMHSLVGLAAVFIGFNAEIEMWRIASTLSDAGLTSCDAALSAVACAAQAGQATLFGDFAGFALKIAQKTGAEIAVLKIEV
ncbi:MAG: NAD(P)(+) transhydrogenase (Re/Si-specific) subunit beta, partial [Allorhizobium sp.]